MQETQLAAKVVEADLHQRIMVTFDPLVSLPVNALGFTASTIQNASLSAQAPGDRVSDTAIRSDYTFETAQHGDLEKDLAVFVSWRQRVVVRRFSRSGRQDWSLRIGIKKFRAIVWAIAREQRQGFIALLLRLIYFGVSRQPQQGFNLTGSAHDLVQV